MFLESPDSYKFTLHVITVIASPLHVFDWGLTVLSVPYLIFPAIGGYTLGILRTWFGVPVVVEIYVMMTIVSFAPTTTVLIFENRFYQLYARNGFWRYLRIFLILFNYLLDAIHVLPACFMIPDQKVALESTYKLIPSLSDKIKSEQLFILSFDYWVKIPSIMIGTKNTVQALLFIGLINRNMNLESRNFTKSENTVNLQRKFLNAIKAQLMVLGINFLLPLTFTIFSISSSYHNQFANNLVIIGISLHGINSSLIMLWAHKTYREYCFKPLKKIRSFLRHTSPVLAVSTQATTSVAVLTLT